MICNQGEKMGTDPKMAQMLGLAEVDFKKTYYNMFKDVKENMNKCEVSDGESQSRYKNYKKEPMEILS